VETLVSGGLALQHAGPGQRVTDPEARIGVCRWCGFTMWLGRSCRTCEVLQGRDG